MWVLLALVPVVEFEPSKLGVENFCELHDKGLWPDHWTRVLGTLGVRALRSGSWLVETSEFATPAALDAVLSVHLEWTGGSVESVPSDDAISPISGGYAFVRNGLVELEPGCCCDLSDLSHWRTAFSAGPGPTPLSIGHAIYSIASREGEAVITITSEVRNQPDSHFNYPAEDFASALKRAEQQQATFEKSLARRLDALGAGARSAEVANLLVYGKRN